MNLTLELSPEVFALKKQADKKRSCVVVWPSRSEKKTWLRSGEDAWKRWKKVAQSFAEKAQSIAKKSELDAKKSVPADLYVLIKSELDPQKLATNARMKNIVIYSCIRGNFIFNELPIFSR
jgi:hypothetical protein